MRRYPLTFLLNATLPSWMSLVRPRLRARTLHRVLVRTDEQTRRAPFLWTRPWTVDAVMSILVVIMWLDLLCPPYSAR